MEKIYQTGKKPLARNNKNKLASYQTLTKRLFSLFGTSVCFFRNIDVLKTYPSLLIFSTYSTPWIPDCQWNMDFGFRSLPGFRIPWAVLRIPKPRIPDSTSKNFPNSLTWSYTNWIFSRVSASIGVDRFSFSFMFCFPNTEHVIFTREFACGVFILKSYAPEQEEMWKKKVPWRKSHGLRWKNNWCMKTKKVYLLNYGFWCISHGSIRLTA